MPNNSSCEACLMRVESIVGRVADEGPERDVATLLCEADWHPHFVAEVVSCVRKAAPNNAFVTDLGVALKRDPTPQEIAYAIDHRDSLDAQGVASLLREDDESIAGRNPPQVV